MLKINNILIENVIFSDEEENVIYAKDFKEEFFGIYNINVLNENILCESKVPNYVLCEVKLNDKTYGNVSFKIKKSNKEKIIINENLLNQKESNSKFKPLKKIIDIEELIKEDIRKEKELLEFKKKVEHEKKVLTENYNSLKNEFDSLKKNKNKIKKEISLLNEEKNQIIKEKNEYVINSELDKIKTLIIEELKTNLNNDGLILENTSNNKNILITEDLQKVNKKVENFENKLTLLEKDKTKTQNLIQTVKSYTDAKIAQALEESKRFTRLMMDMVGGGGGSVAVQLAKGGVIDGDLVVNKKLVADVDVRTVTLSSLEIVGNLDIGGTMSATTILSGGRNITDIFVGEGEGDENSLDGGFA